MHFILSSPRSGSTWLARALAGHPQIFATENRLFGGFCEMWPNRQGRLSPRITLDAYADAFSRHSLWESAADSREDFLDSYLRAYLPFLEAFLRERSGKSIIVDKITPYLGTSQPVLDQIGRFFPKARLIHLVRDGRDVATSGVFDWLSREPVSSDRYRYFVTGEPGFRLQRFFDDPSLLRWADYWAQPIEAVQRAGIEVLEVRYESMLDDQPRQLQRIFDYLEVSADAAQAIACAEQASFERLTGRRRGEAVPTAKARRGTAGDWQQYFTRRDAELFAERVERTLLERYCSVVDDSWIRELPEQLALPVSRGGITSD